MGFTVCILRLSNGQLYVGSTDNLARRLAEHQAGTGCRTTAMFLPVELVYSEVHPDRSSAIERERQLKRWSKAKKLALIDGNATELKRLSRSHSVRPPEQLATTRVPKRGQMRTGLTVQ